MKDFLYEILVPISVIALLIVIIPLIVVLSFAIIKDMIKNR
jgi:hypothetical protein